MAFDPLSAFVTLGSAALGGMAGGKDQTQTSTMEPWGGIQDNLHRLNPAAENVYRNMMPYYPGATFAPMNPLQIGGQFGALDYAQNRFQPGVSTYQQNLQNMMGQDVASNPAVQGMMASNNSQVTDWLREQALPGVRSSATMAGQYGGSRQGIAEGQAIGKGAQALASANSDTMMRAFNPVMAQQTAAAGMMPNALNMGFQGPQTAMNIGSQQQGQFQQGINEAVNRYYYPQNQSQDMLSWLNGIYQPQTAFNQSRTTNPGNPLGSAIGTGLMGASLYNNWNQGSGGNTVDSSINMGSLGSPQSVWSMFNPGPTASF